MTIVNRRLGGDSIRLNDSEYKFEYQTNMDGERSNKSGCSLQN